MSGPNKASAAVSSRSARAAATGKLSTDAALHAIERLTALSLLAGTELQRLEKIARGLDAQQQCPWETARPSLFAGLSAENADTALRKLKLRLKEVQQEAVAASLLQPQQVIELGISKKSGTAPRFLWLSGHAGTRAEARTGDLQGIAPHTLQEATGLPLELLGQAPKGAEPILILTINEHETRAVRAVFSPGQSPQPFERDNYAYELLAHAGRRPVIGFRSRMGSLHAGAALVSTIKAIEHHRPAAVLAVGIAFGNKTQKKQALGDVLVATHVCNYEAERHNPDDSHTRRGDQIPAAANWVQRATQLAPIAFRVHTGLMLSGEKLLDNETALLKLFKDYPQAVGGDMEGAGVMAACHEGKVDWLVIKAVSDWGDGQKNTIGDAEKERHQALAAQHAAAVAYAAVHLAWPAGMSDAPATHGAAAQGAGAISARPIEAKTPDFEALETLLQNHGRQQGIEVRRLQPSTPANNVGDESRPALPALDTLLHWLQEETGGPPLFALLGEYGMGKTICCQHLYHHLRTLRATANPPAWAREPLYFDLRTLSLFKNHERTQTVAMPDKATLINDLIAHGWRSPPGEAVPTYADVQKLLAEGALLILDGLDECLVHLVEPQHPPFIRSLLELLTDADPAGNAGTRLLLSCRTNFFKTLDDQIAFFTGQHRGQVDAEWYRSLVLQPFTEDQVRQYLTQVVPDVPADRLMELVRSTHNLSELAERPMTLKLIGSQISALEALRAQGERINAARLYELVARSWLERDEGKHHLQPEHKLRLMTDLAAHLWRLGVRSLPYDELHRWFHQWRAQQPDLAERYGPAVYNQNKLEEDLRTATFVVREDESARHFEGFRFAHSSLHEFFLARYLCAAVQQQQPEHWALPMPSAETLNFLADLLTNEQERQARTPRSTTGSMPALADTLNTWRQTYRPQASELLLRYALQAPAHAPKPVLAGFDLRMAQLRDWVFGTAATRPAAMLLPMQGLKLQGADLRGTRWHGVRLDDAQLAGARLHQASFEHCSLRRSQWAGAELVGTVFRHCALAGSTLAEAQAYRAQLTACTGVAPGLAAEARNSGNSAAWLTPPAVVSISIEVTPTQLLAPDRLAPKLHWLAGHGGPVSSVTYAPDGTRLISGSYDGTLRLWDTQTGEVIATLIGHAGRVNGVAISPNGSALISCGDDATLRLWDARNCELITTLVGHKAPVNSVAFSTSGMWLISGSDDFTVRLWDARSGNELASFVGHTKPVNAVVIAPDSARVLSGSDDGTVRLWEMETGKLQTTLTGNSAPVSAVAFSHDGAHLLAGYSDGTLCMWDPQLNPILVLPNVHAGRVNAVAFSPDGAYLLSGSADGTTRLWDRQSGQGIRAVNENSSWVNAVAFSPDGMQMVSGLDDGTLCIRNAQTGAILALLTAYVAPNRAVAFSREGAHLLAGLSNVSLWDAQTGDVIQSLFGRIASWQWALALSPDGTRILSGSHDGTLRLLDARTGAAQVTLAGHAAWVEAVAFSPDGTRLLSGSSDRTLRLWDAQSGSLQGTLWGHTDSVTSVAFSPDGTRLLSGSADATVRLWDAQTGTALRTIAGHAGAVFAVAFSPDGSRMVAGMEDHTSVLWNAQTGEEQAKLTGHASWICAVAFSPDGTRVLSGSRDATMRLWDAHSGAMVVEFSGHAASVTAVAFSPDGTRIASSSNDGTLCLWDATTGAALRVHWAQWDWLSAGWRAPYGHAVWQPAGADPAYPQGRLLSASGDAWRLLGWQVWDHPSAPGQWTRLPLEAYPSEPVAAAA